MAFPAPSNRDRSRTSFPQPSTHTNTHGKTGASASRPCPTGGSAPRSSEGDHQLEKLEFALAIALTRGDLERTGLLRRQIAAFENSGEEPGT